MVSIYILLDHEGNIRYVGKAKNPAHRLEAHLKTQGVVKWWADKLPSPPVMQIVDEVEDHLWQHAERFWIRKLKELGCALLNRAEGGQGGAYPKGPEHRKAIGEASRRNWQDPDYKRKVLEGRAGYRHSEETKRKIGDGNRGKAHLGVKHSEETKQLISARRRGVSTGPRSEEAKAATAEAKRKNWADPEFRARVQEAQRRAWDERRKRLAEQAGSTETGAAGGSGKADSGGPGNPEGAGGTGGTGPSEQEG